MVAFLRKLTAVSTGKWLDDQAEDGEMWKE
jgi:hypothetical protein